MLTSKEIVTIAVKALSDKKARDVKVLKTEEQTVLADYFVGTADISATIGGRSVKIEVKVGRDRQSEAQRIYQQQVEAAGGIYYIATDFESFVKWYNELWPNNRI